MSELLSVLAHHGYLLIFVAALAESLGFPVPAAFAFVSAGAAVAAQALSASIALGLAIAAFILGDSLLFVLGRYTGWALLGVLCKVSANPESCILRSAESFYKRGKTTLLFAKFIPGINTMAPPLAGSMRMRPQQFLRLDLAGILLYVLAYFGLGYLGRDFIGAIVRGFRTATHIVEGAIAIALAAYIVYRIRLYRKYADYRVIPRIQVQDLARRLASEKDDALLVDVRSHGYYDPEAERIKGSIRIEPNNLEEELKNLPRDKDIYLYCT
jgi:membrane protein DedA with SNARE-associated domain